MGGRRLRQWLAFPLVDPARIDARRWVMEQDVKEIWIWGYHGGVIDLWFDVRPPQ